MLKFKFFNMKALVLCLMCLFSSSVMAKCVDKWTDVPIASTSQNEKKRLYYSKCNMRKNGDNRIVRLLLNLKDAGRDDPKSAIFDTEYDCVNNRVRALYGKLFSDFYGKGKLIEEGTTAEYNKGHWRDVSDNASQVIIYKRICSVDIKNLKQIKAHEYRSFLGRHSVNLPE